MAYINIGDDLERKAWMMEGLIQTASKSFWSAYTGNGASSASQGAVIQQVNNENASEGHTIVFDYDGNLVQAPVKNKTTAYGKGEEKKKFSGKLIVERYRLVADNGDAFDAVDIGDLSLSQHEDSRAKLADLFVRFKDQAIFDTLQGLKSSDQSTANVGPTHIITAPTAGSVFDYSALLTLEETLKLGGPTSAFSTGSTRRPLVPYTLDDGRPVWLMIMDPSMARMLKTSSTYQSMVFNADVRGNDNRAIKGVFGKIGQLLLIEADAFFGATASAAASFGLDATAVEIAGLRKRDPNGLWTGQTGYITTGVQTSRALILGANAVQMGFGKMPDYKFQPSMDFGITSESALEVWMETQKTTFSAKNAGDYAQGKVANTDWGVICYEAITQAS